MTEKRHARRRRNNSRRILRIGVVLIGLILLATLALSLTRLATPFNQAERLGYNQFWTEAQESLYKRAWVDGQIFYLERNAGGIVRVEVPDPALALTLLTKKEVEIQAWRPQPASGLTPAVLLALCVPYLFLGSMLLSMIGAAAQAPTVGETEEPEPDASALDCPACGRTITQPQDYCPFCGHRLAPGEVLLDEPAGEPSLEKVP